MHKNTEEMIFLETQEHEPLQGLLEVPQDLRLSVMGPHVPLFVQLQLLPDELKQDALHAAFPSIISHHSLSVPYGGYDRDVVQSFWTLVGKETGLTTLHCSSDACNNAEISQELHHTISQLTGLVTLSLPKLSIARSSLTELVRKLKCQETLQHLDLSWIRMRRGLDDASEIARRLAEFSALQTLNLSNIPLDDVAVKALAPCIGQLSGLQSLSLTNSDMDVQSSSLLSQHISKCSGLKTLLCSGNLSGVDLILSLQTCSVLQVLELPSIPDPAVRIEESYQLSFYGGNQINANAGLPSAAEHIIKLTSLQELRFSLQGVFDTELQGLSEHFTAFTSLRVLRLRHVRLGNSPDVNLIALVSSLTSLKELDLTQTYAHRAIYEVQVTGADKLASCLTKLSDLLHITLCGFRFDANLAEANRALMQSLYSLSSLRTLALEKAGLGDAAAIILAKPLRTLLCLQHISLAHNEISDIGMLRIADAVGGLRNLQTMLLGDNKLTMEGIAAIALQFSSLLRLQVLDLSGSRVVDQGALALALQLGLLTALKHLDLAECSITDAGALQLAPVIQTLSALTELNLSRNELTCSGVEAICSIAPHLKSLQELKLWANRFGDAGSQAVAKCVRMCPALVVHVGYNPVSAEFARLWSRDILRNSIRGLHKRVRELPSVRFWEWNWRTVGD